MKLGLQPSKAGGPSNNKYNNRSIYLPKKSFGWIFILCFSFLFMVLAYLAIKAYGITGDIGAVFSGVLLSLLSLAGLLLFIWFFSMRYELYQDVLIIRYGPLKYEIDLYLLTNIRRMDLKPAVGLSLLFPGFSKFVVKYREEGKVFMCATRAYKGIVLLETKKGKLGITPKREDEFIKELEAKMKFLQFMDN